MTFRKIKEAAGVVIIDLPGYVNHIYIDKKWTKIKNRNDFLEYSTDNMGVRISRDATSVLHACKVFPYLGRSLMRRAFDDWAIKFTDRHRLSSEKPLISVIIAFRGKERLGQLMTVLKTFAAQEFEAPLECLVVEQSQTREVPHLPDWIRHIHLPNPKDQLGWYKGWANNVGAIEAKGEIVIFHDADICVPSQYLKEVYTYLKEAQNKVACLGRFLFHLNKIDTERFEQSAHILNQCTPELVRQNWKGGTIAIKKEAFLNIGGYDETLSGWTIEDSELFDRCLTLQNNVFGYLPFLHLWHQTQETKCAADTITANMMLNSWRFETPAETRIDRLKTKQWGSLQFPPCRNKLR